MAHDRPIRPVYASFDVDVSEQIRRLKPAGRLHWIAALLESIEEEGEIGAIRKLVAEDRWNDDAARKTETTEFTCPQCWRHRSDIIDGLHACWYGDCEWRGDEAAFRAAGGTP